MTDDETEIGILLLDKAVGYFKDKPSTTEAFLKYGFDVTYTHHSSQSWRLSSMCGRLGDCVYAIVTKSPTIYTKTHHAIFIRLDDDCISPTTLNPREYNDVIDKSVPEGLKNFVESSLRFML